MKQRTVLVTGAGGFLGCRLVECLLARGGDRVRAMVNRPAGAVRVVRLPVEIVWCDITDEAAVAAAMEGVDAVVHCAYGTAPDARAAQRATVDGTRNLARAAARRPVDRFIHVSTIAVHSYAPPAGVTEASAFGPASDAYCRDKISAERAVRRAVADLGLRATTLRMGNIYGPFSGPWTARPLAHIRGGFESLVDGGGAAANMVYVDNAVEAIIRTLDTEGALGQTFFVVDDQRSWRQYYEQYGRWLGGVPLVSIDRSRIAPLLNTSASDRTAAWFAGLWRDVLVPTVRYAAYRAAESPSLGRLAAGVWRSVPLPMRERFLGAEAVAPPYVVVRPAGQAAEPLPRTPVGLLQVYAGEAAFSNRRAKDVLGFGPAVPFDEAMRRTRAWAAWARLVPPG